MNDFQILITISVGAVGILGTFIWAGLVIYLKVKWLAQLEDIMDDGIRYFSTSIFFAGQGTIRYATIFLWTFHARRCGMLEKRDKVPKYIQKWFIFSFFWMIFCSVLVFGSYAIFEISGEL